MLRAAVELIIGDLPSPCEFNNNKDIRNILE